MDARIAPEGSLEILSREEVRRLSDPREGGLYELWRKCSLAVLKSDIEDDVFKVLERNQRFQISVVRQDRGVALELKNAPDSAFVNGQMIRGMREQLFAVLRDLLYVDDEVLSRSRFDLVDSYGITDAVFHILRNARVLQADVDPRMIVCWGGHSTSREEYDYSKRIGYVLGLREFDICTGCGAGAMKGPMKGAAVGHAKQRRKTGRYLGLTEPTIIAAESPNPIVNELVILPDMEKRLEAFVRVAHAIVVFPGGVGTSEEILYLLGILLDERNAHVRLPVVLTGPASSEAYFRKLDEFISLTLGDRARDLYRIIIDDEAAVAAAVAHGVTDVRLSRDEADEPYFFNWQLNIDVDFQTPFLATHRSMAALKLDRDQSTHSLAVNLRKAFAGIVGGNVRETGIRLVQKHGPFQLSGDPELIHALGELLAEYVQQGRMKLADPSQYVPCYRIV
ncbi:MAG: nucleotide 5'-monophosphate nucleosidase PpnN [Gammaproteobacteria bacterium]|jgi:predicted Rossmann-fold nucleotide-binding protein